MAKRRKELDLAVPKITPWDRPEKMYIGESYKRDSWYKKASQAYEDTIERK